MTNPTFPRCVLWAGAAVLVGHAVAMAQSVADDQYRDRLNLARSVARSEQCGFVDHGMAATALTNIQALIRRALAEGRVPDPDRVTADVEQAIGEGRAADAETCARYGRRSDLRQHQVEIAEMLAYGSGERPRQVP